jgi:acetyl esterase/lipase
MRTIIFGLILVVAFSKLTPYKIDPSKITVGGLSSGAYMSV